MTESGPNHRLGCTSPTAGRDAEAVRAELTAAAPAVRGFLFGLCGDWHASEDLSQEVLLKAWARRESFDGRSELKTWVFAIARNGWLTGLRARSRRPGEQPLDEARPADPAGEPDRRAAQAELAAAVAAALARLPDEQREVLALRELGGLTSVQAAAVLGVPVGTVKSRVRLAMGKLARELEPFREEIGQ